MSSKAGQVGIDDGVAVLTLLRGHCLDIAGKHEITATIGELRTNQSVRALIITSAHPRAWLVDVAELVNMTHSDARAFSESGYALADALSDLPFPTVAAVSGPALGGGCELALACDLIYADENAQFGQIECMGGVIPGFGGTWRLAQRVGLVKAMEMIFTATVLSAQQAREIGLVLDVVSGDRLLPHCHEVAQKIKATSRAAVSSAKRVLRAGAGHSLLEIKDIEQGAFAALFGPEQQVRMKTFLGRNS